MADQKLTLTLPTGDVVIGLRDDLAPGHVARITELAGEGFYDGVVFHRVIEGFMAQGGDSLPVITARPGTRDSGILVRDALGDYIRAETRAGRRIASRVEGRVTVVGRR